MGTDRKKCCRIYYLANRKKKLVWQKKYRLTHHKQVKASKRVWRLAHREQEYKALRRFRKTPRGKEIAKKYNAKRQRQLGFVPLNKCFKSSEGHHVDMERVIYIPIKLHHSVWHSLTLNINMDKINSLAFGFLRSQKEQGFK